MPLVDPKTQLEKDIEYYQRYLADAQAKLAARQAVTGSVTLELRGLAVFLHKAICGDNPQVHGGPSPTCGWYTAQASNDPVNADWTEDEHLAYAKIVQEFVAEMRKFGYTVTEPTGNPPDGALPSVPTIAPA